MLRKSKILLAIFTAALFIIVTSVSASPIYVSNGIGLAPDDVDITLPEPVIYVWIGPEDQDQWGLKKTPPFGVTLAEAGLTEWTVWAISAYRDTGEELLVHTSSMVSDATLIANEGTMYCAPANPTAFADADICKVFYNITDLPLGNWGWQVQPYNGADVAQGSISTTAWVDVTGYD